jgi:hypothetical protein
MIATPKLEQSLFMIAPFLPERLNRKSPLAVSSAIISVC